MADNLHQSTLQPYIDLHEADLVNLRRQADTLRKMMRGKPREGAPKPPPSKTTLRNDLLGIERSIASHEHVIALARDERVTAILQAATDDPELAREAQPDPHTFAARRGIDLPETLEITVFVAGHDVSARFRNLDPDVPFDITWTQNGFQAPTNVDQTPDTGSAKMENIRR